MLVRISIVMPNVSLQIRSAASELCDNLPERVSLCDLISQIFSETKEQMETWLGNFMLTASPKLKKAKNYTSEFIFIL